MPNIRTGTKYLKHPIVHDFGRLISSIGKQQYLIILFWIVFLFPLGILLLYSVAGQWRFPALLPDIINARTFLYLKENAGPIIIHMGSSFLYSIEAVILSIFFSLFPAEFLARNDFPGKKIVESLLLAPSVLPVMTFSVGIHVVFIRLGLSDTHFGVALILSIYSYPYMLRALMAGFATIHTDIITCARNLGAGFWQIIWQIEIPMLLPALTAGGSIVFLVAFSDYFLVFLIGGGSVPSYSGFLFPFLNSSDWSLASGLTLLFIFLPVLLFWLLDMTVNQLYKKWQ